MTQTESTGERLRGAFAALEGSHPATGGCPDPGRIWDAAHAGLHPDRAGEIVDHVAGCPSCAADWRIAMRSEERGQVAPPRRSSWIVPSGLAAAAVLVAAVLVVFFRFGGPGEESPVYRETGKPAIRSLVPDTGTLPRDRVLLRWSSAGENVLYSVEVGTLDLAPLASAYDLEQTEFLVPPETLRELPPGATVVWRVEALLPDGRRKVSEAFLVRIE